MPEDLVMVAGGLSDDYIWLNQKQTYGLRRGSKGHHIVIQFHQGEKYWQVEDQYEDYELRAQGKHDSYGSWPFHGPTIDSAIEWVEKTYDVKIKIVDPDGKPYPIEEVRRRAQLMLEEAVAPKPKEIGLFDVMESNSEEVLKSMLEDGIVIARKAGVGEGQDRAVAEQAMHFVLENFEEIVRNLDLEIPNENWNDDLKYGRNTFNQGKVSDAVGRIEVKRKFKEILDRTYESIDYECEKDWGVLPREPYKMGEKSKGEQIAEQLWEVAVAGPRREELAKLASEDARKEQASICKKAAKHFLSVYAQSMRRRVEQLR